MSYTKNKEGEIIVSDMKDIKGFEGLYAITKDGRIWGHPNIKRKTARFLHTKVNKRDGYVYMILYKEGKAITRKVHRLVALTYIYNPENKPEVNHKNGIKTDNCVENLEWNTRQENAKHAAKNHFFPTGERHHNCIVSDKEIINLRFLSKQGKHSQSDLGKLFGISQTQVWRLVNNLTRVTN